MDHNADHVIRKQMGLGPHDKVPQGPVEALIRGWLDGVNNLDIDTIVDAGLNHTNPNSPEDSKVLIAIEDGDRIVNMDLDVICRAGQYRSEIPVVDYEQFLDDPTATFGEPKSVYRDIWHCLEWVDPQKPKFCVRTKRAMQMGKERAKLLELFFDKTREQLREEGLSLRPFTK